MKLLGSTTSPYVRRIRLYLYDKEVEFVNLNIFNPQDRALLTAYNPAQKIPVLIDDDVCVNDSGVIYRYLTNKFAHGVLSWHQENLLTMIDAANDSMVSILLLSRSEIDVKQDGLFFNLQQERVENVLESLNQAVDSGDFDQWHYPSMSLFCLLDWLLFRDVFQWDHYNSLIDFYKKAKDQRGVQETDPRKN
ncbi:glutathione S-transferase family protein [Thalassotalea piscium]